MTPDEALKLCRFTKALSPAQAVDEYQPEAWALVLRRVNYADAMTALEELGGEQEWTHVSHIVARVKRIRSKRVVDYGPLPDPPPGHNPDDTRAHQRYLAEATKRIADGEMPPEPPKPAAIRGRDVIAALGQAGTPVDVTGNAAVLREATRKARMELQEAAAVENEKRRQKDAEREAARLADRAAHEALVRRVETSETEGESA